MRLVWARWSRRLIFLLMRLLLSWLLVLFLRRTILRWRRLLALLLPVAELVLVFTRLGCVFLLHRGHRLCLGM